MRTLRPHLRMLLAMTLLLCAGTAWSEQVFLQIHGLSAGLISTSIPQNP